MALVYSGIGLSIPSFWVDEAATISAVDRTFPDMMRMLGNIDAVHGFYYLLMYGWTSLFGLSELSLRLPSLLAVALAAGLLAAIGRRLGSPAYGFAAAVLFVLLPRTQYIATDARSYALALAASVAATYFLVRLRARPERRFWVGYAAAGLLATLLSFYTVLVFLAHAVTVFLDPGLRNRWRGLLAASPAWLVPTGFLAAVGASQQFQIAWIRPIDGGVLAEVGLLQFFSDAYLMHDGEVSPRPTPFEDLTMFGLAVLLWAMAILSVFLLRRHVIVLLALPLLVLPLAAVIGGSLIVGSPYYLPRYLSFILPAVPLLAAAVFLRAGAPIDRRARWVPVGAVAAVAVLALPSYLGQRTEFGRSPEDDFRFVAETIQHNARPGDAFALLEDGGLSYLAYRDSFAGLADVTVGISAAEWGRIYDQRFDLAASEEKILENDIVWVAHPKGDTAAEETMRSFGYHAEQRFDGTGNSVVKFVND